MDKDSPEYTVRDYGAVDLQVAEIARRERILSNKLVIANYFQLAKAGLLAAAAISLIILAIGIAFWFAKDDCTRTVITERAIGYGNGNNLIGSPPKKY